MTRLEEIALELLENNKIRNGTYVKDKELLKEAQSIQDLMVEQARKGDSNGDTDFNIR